MNVSELITNINDLSDEQESPSLVLNFINDAIAKINIYCDAVLPSVTLQDTPEYMLPEKWLRTLVIPFAVGRIKQRDSSQFEYSDAYQEFVGNLDEFKAKFEIPEEYVDGKGDFEPEYGWARW